LVENKSPKLIPNLIGYRRPVALKLAQEHSLRITTVGDGNIIVSQEPLPGSVNTGDERVLLITEQRYESQPGDKVVPDVIGLPLRNALNVLAIQRISAVVDGTGKVVQQKPAAGQPLKPNEQVLLFCESSIDVGKILAL
jgi:beta-lactam-binding protein with PASTA domain